MLTYQDLLAVGDNDAKKMDFARQVISWHKSTDLYRTAVLADEYDRHKNRTITQYQKFLYTLSGAKIIDSYSANYKLASNFFSRFVTQQNQFLLGNGVSWKNRRTGDKLGKDFDAKLQKLGRDALVAGVAFGFFNLDHLETFHAREFAPLYDEENGALAAGVRFWQIDPSKPLRATLYELEGYTEYIWRSGTGEVLKDRQPYKKLVRQSKAEGVEIYDGGNYPSFPIVPLYANPHRQSELVGLQEQIDAYDLIKSGFCNTVDEASIVYWLIKGAGGMDDIDLAQFLQRLRTNHIASADSDQEIQPETTEAPSGSREALLNRIRADLYADFMALDTDNIVGGAATATQIRAAYEPLNNKADQYEYCVLEFLRGILAIAGLDDEPTFTRSMLVNAQEEVQTVLQAATVLDTEYLTRKVLTLLGDGDKADEVLRRMEDEDIQRIEAPGTQRQEEQPEPEEQPIKQPESGEQ